MYFEKNLKYKYLLFNKRLIPDFNYRTYYICYSNHNVFCIIFCFIIV